MPAVRIVPMEGELVRVEVRANRAPTAGHGAPQGCLKVSDLAGVFLEVPPRARRRIRASVYIADRLADEVSWLRQCADWLAHLDADSCPPAVNLRASAVARTWTIDPVHSPAKAAGGFVHRQLTIQEPVTGRRRR